MKDKLDPGTLDFFDEEEEDEFNRFSEQELNFNNNDDEALQACPCCYENEVSQDQIDCQSQGEQCTICNYHTWEEY